MTTMRKIQRRTYEKDESIQEKKNHDWNNEETMREQETEHDKEETTEREKRKTKQ